MVLAPRKRLICLSCVSLQPSQATNKAYFLPYKKKTALIEPFHFQQYVYNTLMQFQTWTDHAVDPPHQHHKPSLDITMQRDLVHAV